MNGPFALRALLLTSCLVPYVYFGVRDVLHHKQHRQVTWTERLLHLSLGMTLAIVLPHAYMGHWDVVIPGIFIFTAARAFDEFVFHRGLAAAEADLHAKTHFGFLIFVVGVIGAGWLQRQSHLP
jgi:hypothetical protein